MPIFARRTLQRLLNELGPLASSSKQRSQIASLNKGGQDAISTAWELAVTSALASLGVLHLEPDLGTAARVDFQIRLASNRWHAIGDVVTVFDQGMHEASGLEALERAVWSRVDRYGLRRSDFLVWIDGDVAGMDRKRRIRLPRLDEAALFRDLDPFLASIKVNRRGSSHVDLRRNRHGLQIRYEPHGRGGYFAGVKVDAVYGLDANPLMNALRRKAAQLRRTQFAGPRIIICCDGGSDALRARVNSAWNTPSTEHIVRDFLRQHTSIAAVIVVLVNEAPLNPVLDSRKRAPYRTPFALGVSATSTDHEAVHEISTHLGEALPRVVRRPSSFRKPWEAPPTSRFFRNYGFRAMTSDKSNWHIDVPLRALQELLAGQISLETFQRRHLDSAGDPVAVTNLVRIWTDMGRMITGVELVAERDLDDDWIRLSFADGDPATSPLRPAPTAAHE